MGVIPSGIGKVCERLQPDEEALGIWHQPINARRPNQNLGWSTPQHQRGKSLGNDQRAAA